MAIRLADKKAIVAEVSKMASDALSLVIADARGVTVGEITGLRELARENAVQIKIVRNSLAKIALEGTEFECVREVLSGPSMFGFSMEDPGAAARLFKDFAKENQNFEVKNLSLSGQLLGPDQLDVLASLPTREVALSKLISLMVAPTTRLALALNDVPSKLVRTFTLIKDQKQMAA